VTDKRAGGNRLRPFFFGAGYNEDNAMPARDIYHNAAKNALIKDGWTITHDPSKLKVSAAPPR
jgi:hypothetical protein